jgi:hypothetical protein
MIAYVFQYKRLEDMHVDTVVISYIIYCTVHCPKTHEQFPSSFGNAEVISSDRRKLFINIFSKTT